MSSAIDLSATVNYVLTPASKSADVSFFGTVLNSVEVSTAMGRHQDGIRRTLGQRDSGTRWIEITAAAAAAAAAAVVYHRCSTERDGVRMLT